MAGVQTAHENRRRLAAFVVSSRRQAAGLPPAEAEGMLRSYAEVLRRHLCALERPGRTPAHLEGLTAFDLADAADALEAAAGGSGS